MGRESSSPEYFEMYMSIDSQNPRMFWPRFSLPKNDSGDSNFSSKDTAQTIKSSNAALGVAMD